MVYRYEAFNKIPAKLKIEINIAEHFQVLPLKIVPFFMDSAWFKGSTAIVTYELDELIATKLRALYQRRKGRDLFDIWYVIARDLVNLDQVLEIFYQYCRYNGVKITGEAFLKNLELKKHHRDFRKDMSVLLPSRLRWDFDEAYNFVVEKIIKKML